MLTAEDIKKLASILATKEDIKELRDYTESEVSTLRSDIKELRDYTESEVSTLRSDIRDIKEDVAGLRESLQGMIVATDNLTKVITDLHMEYTAITYQLKRHEDWIRQIAAKAGVSLTS